MNFLACFLSMNLVIMSCYNGKGLNRSGISKLGSYKRQSKEAKIGGLRTGTISEYEEGRTR